MNEYNVSSPISSQKPRQITVAVQLLVASIAIALVSQVYDAVMSPTKFFTGGTAIFSAVFSYTVQIFIVYNINRAKKWARNTFAVLFVLGALFYIPFASTIVAFGPTVMVVWIAQGILEIIAMILMFGREGRAWFNRPNEDRPITEMVQ